MKHKVQLTVEVTIEDRSDHEVARFMAEGLGRDLINGGAIVVTARGTEECGITSAVVKGVVRAER